MIVTVTPNPSLDRTFDVPSLAVGEVNRASGTHVHPGGKGINVSRALSRHGVATRAVLPLGGADGIELSVLLRALDVEVHAVALGGSTRSNVAVVDASGVTTKVNAAGPRLAADEVSALVAAVELELDAVRDDPSSWLVLAGSVPEGAGEDLYPRLVAAARARGVAVAVDASGDDLAGTVAAGGTDLLKPNLEELWHLLGHTPTTVGGVADGARSVLGQGHRRVLVSLGPDGALLVTPDGTWWAGGPPLVPRSTVGAGDCTLAGFLSADGAPAERLRTAVAWGRAAVSLPGSAAPGPDDLDLAAVRVVPDPPADALPRDLAPVATG
ncbi:1-phosphofructokinase family hexose kinase [Cellulomonas sp. HZM]|uniref:1-phosphofructokinase family hexose kinase n=1 Tax=Cellulomonas sp. HZM TaxID=1454010 RepID=UPI00049384DE|nr:1-phosphofructokinase family hexose kinase [Cellulomonas sp. HZM]